MTEETYEAISRPFRANPRAGRWLVGVNKALTILGYVVYPLLLIEVAFAQDWMALAKFLIVPGTGFALLSIFRSRYNAPRPYEVLGIDPIIKKDTRGKSFPSRHTFSIMMIAFTWCAWRLPVGISLVVLGCVMAATRVVGGVHFPRDVVAGALFAALWAVIGYVLIPW